MMYQRIQTSSSWNPPTQQKSSQLSPRLFTVQAQQNSPNYSSQEEKEKQAFGQDRYEASQLQLKEKIGTLTSVEQERLGVLQAKMNDFWVQKRERASRFGHNLANILVRSPHKQGSATVQPKQASQLYREGAKQQSPQQLSETVSKEGIGLGQREFSANLLLPSNSMSTLQPKLTIGEPGDKYEQEADSVAAEVVNQINSPQFQQQGQAVQRQSEPEEEELQAKPEITSLQRMEEPEEEELQAKPSNDELQRSPLRPEIQLEEMPEEEKEEELQTKSILQRREATAGEEASMDLESAINNARGSGQALDAGLQRSMGQAMGADFSGVIVHTDAQSDQLNQSIQARAFTTGQDVFFRQGEYNPGSRGGQELIAHELTHVVQQNGGKGIQRSPIIENPSSKILSPLAGDKVAGWLGGNGRLQIQATNKCNCASCSLLGSQKQQVGDRDKPTSNHRQTGIIQRLAATPTAKQASDQAVKNIDNSIGGSQLLSGWGNSTAGRAGHNFTAQERAAVNALGDKHGCCICQTKDPGTKPYRTNAAGKNVNVGNFIPDHEPPNSLANAGYTGTIKFYPHCLTHSNMQAGVVARYKKEMKTLRSANDSDWATGVLGTWFWN